MKRTLLLCHAGEVNMEISCSDHLQNISQSLGDNLEFSAYEVFEKYSIKYEPYRQAVDCLMHKT